ncbi:MAG TPA: ATP-binding protein [Steroidobacteraceae bacterium]|nr:ATP-binding protein [Steroidobacteraceae bacterium]
MKVRSPGLDNIWIRFAIPVVIASSVMLVFSIVMLSHTFQRDANDDVTQRARLLMMAVEASTQFDVMSGNREQLQRTIEHAMREEPIVARIQIFDERHQIMASASAENAEQAVAQFSTPIRTELSTVDLFNSDTEPHIGDAPPSHASAAAGRVIGFVEVRVRSKPIIAARMRGSLYGIVLTLLAGFVSVAVGLAVGVRFRQQLRTLIHALRQIGSGDLSVELPGKSPGEIGAMERTINQMARELDHTRGELEARVRERTDELQKAIERLAASDQQRQRLIAGQTAMLEEERRRISVEMHDHINSNLALIQLLSNDLQEQSQRLVDAHVAPVEGARMLEAATRIGDMTQKLYSTARGIVRTLRPESLDVLGLPRTVEELIHQFNAAGGHCLVQFTESPNIPPLRGPVAVTAYRVIQEALSNIVKHANAVQADVSLLMNSEVRELQLVVTDNGCGFDTRNIGAAGIGLASMRERVEGAGGQMLIRSGRTGTTIEVTLPLSDAEPTTNPR